MIPLSENAVLPAEKKSKASKPAEDQMEGMVLWADGSAAPTNPGFGGWGIHGYIYSSLPPKKGSGNSTQVPTASGYVPKAEVKAGDQKEVKPLHYVDAYSSFPGFITNNVGEIAGATNGFLYAAQHPIKKFTLFTDSKYVVEGSTQWMPAWKRNNWIKTDGQPVANKEHWLALSDAMEALKAKGVQTQVKWVKGHSIHLGNQLADKYATIGNLYSRVGEHRTSFETQPPEGYWTPKNEKHPFISQRRIYFSTRDGSNVPGEYHLGEHGKDDELLGKRMADGAYSFIALSQPEPFIELMRNKQTRLANGNDAIIMGRLDKLFEAETYRDFLRFGEICMHQPSAKRLDMHVLPHTRTAKLSEEEEKLHGEPLTKELRPPLLAMRAVESVNLLHGILLNWKDIANRTVVSTDVTPLFYEQNAKDETVLKPEFIVGFSVMTLNAAYETDKKQKATAPVELYLGVDLPARNYLKRLEKLDPHIHIVTWRESETSFRHATVIQSGSDYGIWAGMYSNLRFYDPDKIIEFSGMDFSRQTETSKGGVCAKQISRLC